MDRTAMRGVMAGIGALAGACFYALGEVWAEAALPPRATLFLLVAGLAFFAGLLVMAGPVGPRRAALAALATALPVAALVTWASLRQAEAEDLFSGPSEALAALLLGMMPWPFWIAAFRGDWSDYATLFRESWSAVIRLAAGLVFTGLVWGVIFLSDALLSLVGLDVIERLVEVDAVPFIITGAVTGLAMAVVTELSDLLAPDLLLRLLRLLLPVVALVMAVFLVALPLRGFDTVLGGLSVAGTLLGMAGVAVALVAAACDEDDTKGAEAPLMGRAAQGLAALVAVPGALAAWALALRVAEAGWTPPRVAGAVVTLVALGYGAGYLWALAGGGGWRGRVRGANRAMAVAILALAALWLTPVLDAQAIAARDQVARYADGRTPLDRLDLAALDRWGRAGEAALAELETLAAAPGQEALAERLADRSRWSADGAPNEAAREALRRILPVVPAEAEAEAAGLVDSLQPWDLREWRTACERRLPDGRAACVLVMADLWPAWPPGDPAAREAVFLAVTEAGWLSRTAMTLTEDGRGWSLRGVGHFPGNAGADDGAAMIAAILDRGPVLEPVAERQLRLGDGAVRILQ